MLTLILLREIIYKQLMKIYPDEMDKVFFIRTCPISYHNGNNEMERKQLGIRFQSNDEITLKGEDILSCLAPITASTN